MNFLKRIWRRITWDRDVARLNAQWTVHKLRMIDLAKDRDECEKLYDITNANLHESELENSHLREKLRDRKKHLRIANRALAIRHWQNEALNGRVLTLCEQRAELHKRIQELEAFVRDVRDNWDQDTWEARATHTLRLVKEAGRLLPKEEPK